MSVDALALLCYARHLPRPVSELRFHPPRRWRFDYAWPDRHVALEVDGGVWVGGRHTRGAGFTRDIEKFNQAVLDGWRVFHCTPAEVRSGKVADLLAQALN